MKNILRNMLSQQVSSKSELIKILNQAASKHIIENDSLPIIEAVFNIANLRAKDIMIPRLEMDVLDINDSTESIIKKIIETGHSRFPVIDEDMSDILGVFHSKDLIHYVTNPEEFNLRDQLRRAYFVPEIKHLDGLMYEMRLHQSHMAIVVDEFTNVVGIVTLEMIVEQIVGEIEDEHDSVEGEREIITLGPDTYRVKGQCKLSQFNSLLELNLLDEKIETVGGFLVKFLGRIPAIGEVLDFEKIKIEVINSDSRKINLLMVTKK